MTRCTVTEVAWFTPAHPVAAAGAEDGPDDVAGADEVAPAPAGAEAVTEPHPASAEDSSTASTAPRTWRGDITVF
jgi:hypothetical protein